MRTTFTSLNDLKKNIEIGQKIYIENFVKPERSRVTQVKNKYSYFFSVENNEGGESWIINGAQDVKHIGASFNSDFERVDLYFKATNKPFVSLYFNETIIKGKE